MWNMLNVISMFQYLLISPKNHKSWCLSYDTFSEWFYFEVWFSFLWNNTLASSLFIGQFLLEWWNINYTFIVLIVLNTWMVNVLLNYSAILFANLFWSLEVYIIS